MANRRWPVPARSPLRRAAVSLGCVVALLVTGCSSPRRAAGAAATLAPDNRLEVAGTDGSWQLVVAGATVAAGARVRTGATPARLQFRNGFVELAPNAAAVVAADRVELTRGELLASGVAASWTDTEVAGDATFRLAGGVTSRVGVYRGEVSVRRPAQDRAVGALRELDLGELRLPAGSRPLRYAATDPWDQQLLAGAIAFDGEAARLAGGIDNELGTAPRPPDFYAAYADDAIVPLLAEAAVVVRGDAFGPPSDSLLTLFVTKAASPEGDADPATVRQVAALRDAGARWGLVATELGVSTAALTAAVDAPSQERVALVERRPRPAPPSPATVDAMPPPPAVSCPGVSTPAPVASAGGRTLAGEPAAAPPTVGVAPPADDDQPASSGGGTRDVTPPDTSPAPTAPRRVADPTSPGDDRTRDGGGDGGGGNGGGGDDRTPDGDGDGDGGGGDGGGRNGGGDGDGGGGGGGDDDIDTPLPDPVDEVVNDVVDEVEDTVDDVDLPDEPGLEPTVERAVEPATGLLP